MTQREKLIQEIRRRPSDANFAHVRGLLEQFGWKLDRQRGSQVTFVKEGRPFTFPLVKGRKVRRPYLERLCDLLGLDD